MTWIDAVKLAIALAPMAGIMAWALIYMWGSQKWAGKADAETTRRIAESNRERILTLEGSDRNMTERFARDVVEPLRLITEDLRTIAKTQRIHGEQLAAYGATQEAQGDTLRDIRQRMDRRKV